MYTLSSSMYNNCVLLDRNTPVMVRNILQSNVAILLVCEEFTCVQDAFQSQLPSSRFNIFRVSGKCQNMLAVPLSDVLCRCVCWPLFCLPMTGASLCFRWCIRLVSVLSRLQDFGVGRGKLIYLEEMFVRSLWVGVIACPTGLGKSLSLQL